MNKFEIIKQTLEDFLNKMGFSYTNISIDENEQKMIRVNIETEEAALLIGAQGKNLEAIQHILKSILFKKLDGEHLFLIVDVESFKLRREEQMLDLAREKAEVVKTTHITQMLPALNPYLRKMVHMEMTKPEYNGIATDSVGEEGYRRVRLFWKGRTVSDVEDNEIESDIL